MDGPIPTQIGDVLILRTTRMASIFAVGTVSMVGQQNFAEGTFLAYSEYRREAIAQAKALAAPGRRIFFRNLDTDRWSELVLV